jgi:hypothetical protein
MHYMICGWQWTHTVLVVDVLCPCDYNARSQTEEEVAMHCKNGWPPYSDHFFVFAMI